MKPKTMRLLAALALLVVLYLAGCSGDSPTSHPFGLKEPAGKPAQATRVSVAVPTVSASTEPVVVGTTVAQGLPQSLTWTTCGSCPEAAEVAISGNTITLGIKDRAEGGAQPIARHAASALLPKGAGYTITFDYDLHTWDAYNAAADAGTGYWDSFSVSVSAKPYWQLTLSDPITTADIPQLLLMPWGGDRFGDGIARHNVGSKTVTLAGNPNGALYLNLALDTATDPDTDSAYPSWGTITVREVKTAAAPQSDKSSGAPFITSVAGSLTWNWSFAPKFPGYYRLEYLPSSKDSCGVAGAQFLVINGANFGTAGTATLSDIEVEVDSWSDKVVKLRAKNVSAEPRADQIVTLTRASDSKVASYTISPGVIPVIATRVYGQCTWWAARRRIESGLCIPNPGAYVTNVDVNGNYVPQFGDVLMWNGNVKHQAFIEDVTSEVESDVAGVRVIAYHVHISQYNAGCRGSCDIAFDESFSDPTITGKVRETYNPATGVVTKKEQIVGYAFNSKNGGATGVWR